MPEPSTHPSPASPLETANPPDRAGRLDLARRLYREFHGRCFWHSPADLDITEELIPFVVKGLRTYGGHRGFLLAGKLRVPPQDRLTADKETPGCP